MPRIMDDLQGPAAGSTRFIRQDARTRVWLAAPLEWNGRMNGAFG
jgi:hypothetical protein